MNFGKAHEKQLGLFRCALVLTIILFSLAGSLFADSVAPKTVTLCFKSYEPDVTDGKSIFYINSSEVPVDTGDWHPGMVDKGYKLHGTVGSFTITKFLRLQEKGGYSLDDTDKSVLFLESDTKPPVKVVLPIGQNVTVTLK